MIPPPTQRSMSERAGSTVEEDAGSHAIYVSQPWPHSSRRPLPKWAELRTESSAECSAGYSPECVEGAFSEVRSAPVQHLSVTLDENGGLPAFAPSISSGQYLHQLLRC